MTWLCRRSHLGAARSWKYKGLLYHFLKPGFSLTSVSSPQPPRRQLAIGWHLPTMAGCTRGRPNLIFAVLRALLPASLAFLTQAKAVLRGLRIHLHWRQGPWNKGHCVRPGPLPSDPRKGEIKAIHLHILLFSCSPSLCTNMRLHGHGHSLLPKSLC